MVTTRRPPGHRSAAPADADGTPPWFRGPGHYLWWLVLDQRRRALLGAVLGSGWMVGLTLPPYLLSRAVDDGLVPDRWPALLGWAAALLAVGLLNAWLAIMRHRTMTRARLHAAFRTSELVVRQSVRLGGALARRTTSGEAVAIAMADVSLIGRVMTATGPGVGAVVAYGVVAVELVRISAPLAVVVLVGVPLLLVVVGPLFGRLGGAAAAYREEQGLLAARFADLAGGLRVLAGLGGRELFAERYRAGSRRLRDEGYRVGAVSSWIEAVGVGLPAVFLAAVVWPAARMAVSGSVTAGQLTAVYGYVAVLVVPVSFFVEFGADLGRGRVAARRVVRFLALEPDAAPAGVPGPAGPSVLHDPRSGVRVVPGRLTALAADRPEDAAAVVDRLGALARSDATWGGTPLDTVAPAEVRERITVADHEADLFAGTLREVLAGRFDRDADGLAPAVRAAAADDVVRGVPGGWEGTVSAQGRNLSGGQRQRLRLARALAAEPEVLLAVEPTSAVDAHTEAAMAAGLREARAGRTTLVTTTSPLLLDRADTVLHLTGGRVAASGAHGALLRDRPDYRALVARGDADEDATPVPAGGGLPRVPAGGAPAGAAPPAVPPGCGPAPGASGAVPGPPAVGEAPEVPR